MCVLVEMLEQIESDIEFSKMEKELMVDFNNKQQKKQNIERSKLVSKNDLKEFLKEERKAKTDRWMAGRFRL
jgi:ribosomal protein S8